MSVNYKEMLVNYIDDIMESFKKQAIYIKQGTSEDIFRILTSRKFCYQSKKKTESAKKIIEKSIEIYLNQQKPIKFIYNIGGGYHASLEPGKKDISFNIGLSELLLLYQIHRLHIEVSKKHKYGICFILGISNLNAEALYNVPVSLTVGYANQLRNLISSLNVFPATVLLESEFCKSYNDRKRNEFKRPTEYELIQIKRFVGLSHENADFENIQANYDWFRKLSRLNFSTVEDGIQISQRSNNGEISFRSYPGGDCKLQTGEVMLSLNSNNKIIPKLITSKTVKNFHKLVLDNCPVSLNVCI